MDRVNIIHDLLDWIETHLDQPLLLDNVAAKSGYSKWHLQRMFRSTTGHALGSYIRERRLSQAAQALRSTPRPILDIALQYHFDSQPSFRAPSRNSSARPRRCIAAPPAGMSRSGRRSRRRRRLSNTATPPPYRAGLPANCRKAYAPAGWGCVNPHGKGTKKGSVREN